MTTLSCSGSIALPITKPGFDGIIAAVREQVKRQHEATRDAFLDKLLKNSKKHRESQDRTAAEVDAQEAAITKANNPLLASSDPFKATWLPGRGDIPSIPPREVAAAATKGKHPLEPKEGLSLDEFMLTSDRLLAMTVEEIKSISYIDGWIFKFCLETRMDFELAAKKFHHFRTVIHKHSLSFDFDESSAGGLFNGLLEVDPIYFQFANSVAGSWVGSEEAAAAEAAAASGVGEDGDSRAPSTSPPLSPGNHDEEDESELEEGLHIGHQDDEGVSSGTSSGRSTPQPAEVASVRCPVILHRPRYIDWKTFTLQQIKQHLFFFGCSLIASDYFNQVHGSFGVNSSKGNRARDFSKELLEFEIEMGLSMPAKGNTAFICNEGWLFTKVLGPLLRLTVSKEQRKQIILVSGQDYTQPLSTIGPGRLPSEVGGRIHRSRDESTESPTLHFFREMMKEKP